MQLEDYNEYYIQGSDHYLIPKAVFIELYKEMANFREEITKYKEAIDKAVDIAWRFGQTDEAHHQKWVTDQMVRALLGSDYESFVKDYEEDDDYEWDIGIAP